MNLRITCCFCIVSLIASLTNIASSSEPEKFEIDNRHTSIIFAVQHFGVSFVYGRFNRCSGDVVIHGEDASRSKFNVVIDAKSLDTNDPGRDLHLKGEEFFDVEQFPIIEFKSKEVKREGRKFFVSGDLTICGKTKEVTMALDQVGNGDGPFGKKRIGFLSKFRIKRSEFGMDQMLPSIGDDVAVTFCFEAIQQKDGDTASND